MWQLNLSLGLAKLVHLGNLYIRVLDNRRRESSTHDGFILLVNFARNRNAYVILSPI